MSNTERYKKLTLLHSNDMHGDFFAEDGDDRLIGGVSMLSGYISKVKEEEENVLYCIAGDMFRGSIIDSEYKGISTIEIMNMLAPDIVTIGNHEIDYGLSHLLFIEKCAKFPIINANLYVKMNGSRLFSPYKIIEIGGMKILFIGILTADVIAATKTDTLIGSLVDIDDAAKEIAKICNTFNGIDIDFTVLLTHIGFENDIELAKTLDPELGVDVIIGGHSHTFIDEPSKVNDILIVQAGTGTDQVGRFDIVVDTDTNSVESYKWEAIPINSKTCPKDEKMEELIAKLKSKTDLKYGKTLRRLNRSLKHPTRYRQTTLGCFMADIFKKQLGVDVMVLTSGSIRVKSIGPIVSLQDAMEEFPFVDSLYEIVLTGKQFKKMMKYIYRDDALDLNKDTEFYQLSYGIKAVYNQTAKEFVKLEYNGKPINDDQRLSVGIRNFDINNLKQHLGLDLEEVKENFKPRVICKNITELYYEFLESDLPLPEYPIKDRVEVIEA